MSERLKDKVAIVTGGSTGIGRSTATRLASEGAKVVITGRNETTLKEAAELHGDIEYVVADVSKTEDVQKVLKHVEDKYGKLDILVNNAGIAKFLPLADVDLEHIDEQFNTNVRGLVDMTRQALPLLIASKGSVINNASVVADDPMMGGSVYSATKAAVVALTKSWARELAGEGVRVNVVSPGPIETPIFGKTGMAAEDMEKMAEQIQQMVPMGRFGQPEEIAAAIVYLASDDAGYVTGTQIKVDGGMAA